MTLVFFSLCFSLQLIAMLIAVVSPTQMTGNTLAYSLVLAMLLTQSFLCSTTIQNLLH